MKLKLSAQWQIVTIVIPWHFKFSPRMDSPAADRIHCQPVLLFNEAGGSLESVTHD